MGGKICPWIHGFEEGAIYEPRVLWDTLKPGRVGRVGRLGQDSSVCVRLLRLERPIVMTGDTLCISDHFEARLIG